MISKSLHIQILLRVLLLMAASLLLGWILISSLSIILLVIPLTIMVAVVLNLSHYLNRVNRRIFYFFDAIKNEDSSLSFPEEKTDRIIRDLSQSMLKVNRQIQQVHLENRKQEQYFQALIEHAATGMFTFNNKGFVLHSNSQAKQLFGVDVFTHIKQLETIDTTLHKTISEIQAGEHRLISVSSRHGVVQLLIRANMFIAEKDELMLLSVQDIKTQLDEKELDAWRKLIRVMMHEIMNSITPITSLSESLAGYYYEGDTVKTIDQIDEKTVETTIHGLEVIREQGKALINFVESYRKLSRLPDPVLKTVSVGSLVESIRILYESYPASKSIRLQCEVDPADLQVNIDEKLISQVLINLVKNAFQAMENMDGGTILVKAGLNANMQTEITVSDNGPGIPGDLLEKVSIPFFTTKENGSGIGLSLSRQIMQMHGGSMKIESKIGKGAEIVLTF